MSKIKPRIPYEKAPEQFRGGLERYIEHKILPGGFLTAVLKNDLSKAHFHADPESWNSIRELINWLDLYAPPFSWGSLGQIEVWLLPE